MTLALLACLCLQDGGAVPWVGRGQDPVDATLESVKKLQKPILLFFCAEGNAACKKLSDGPFRDPDVIAAADKIACVYVESTAKQNAEFRKKLGVTQIPTLVVCDWRGTMLGGIPERDAHGIAAALRKLIEANEGLPPLSEDIPASIATAKKKKLPLLIYFYDDSPPSLAVNSALNDPLLKPMRPKFTFARVPMKRDSPLCKQYDVDHAPEILILNVQLAKPEEKPLLKISGSRSAHELQRDLEQALDAARGAGLGGTDPTLGADAVPQPAKPEKLSEDEVDRKFIRARFSYGMELAKKGEKAKAVEVLEDVVATFPKHVETLAVKKYLDELKAGN